MPWAKLSHMIRKTFLTAKNTVNPSPQTRSAQIASWRSRKSVHLRASDSQPRNLRMVDVNRCNKPLHVMPGIEKFPHKNSHAMPRRTPWKVPDGWNNRDSHLVDGMQTLSASSGLPMLAKALSTPASTSDGEITSKHLRRKLQPEGS
jgi:hypothetical protein